MSETPNRLPNLDQALFAVPDLARLMPAAPSTHPPRFLLLYGSLRERSYSRLLAEEAGHLLQAMGAEVRFFDPTGLPLADSNRSPGSTEYYPELFAQTMAQPG